MPGSAVGDPAPVRGSFTARRLPPAVAADDAAAAAPAITAEGAPGEPSTVAAPVEPAPPDEPAPPPEPAPPDEDRDLTGEFEDVEGEVPTDLFRHITDDEAEALATAAGLAAIEATPPTPQPPVEPPAPPEPVPPPPPPQPTRGSPDDAPDTGVAPTRIRVHDDRLDQRAEPLDLSPSEALRLAQEGRAGLRRKPSPTAEGRG